MKKMTFFMAILFVIATTGCNSAKKNISMSPSYEGRMPEIKNIIVMADLALMHDIAGSPYEPKDSQKISKYAMEAASSYLKKKGYSSDVTPVLGTGAFLNPEEEYNVFTKEDGVHKTTPPFFISNNQGNMDGENLQKTKLLRQVQCCIQGNILTPHLKYEKLSGKRNYIKSFQEVESADAILVVFGYGKDVSGLKTASQELGNFLIGVGTGVASGGVVAVMPTHVDKSYLHTYAALIDTRTNEMLWSNHQYFDKDDYLKDKFYTKSWNKKLLSYLKKAPKATKG